MSKLINKNNSLELIFINKTLLIKYLLLYFLCFKLSYFKMYYLVTIKTILKLLLKYYKVLYYYKKLISKISQSNNYKA